MSKTGFSPANFVWPKYWRSFWPLMRLFVMRPVMKPHVYQHVGLGMQWAMLIWPRMSPEVRFAPPKLLLQAIRENGEA